jgi:hypothetical protein
LSTRVCTVGRGEEALLAEQVFQSRFEGGLVALDRQQIVPASLEEDVLPGFTLGMHRVGDHDLAPQTPTRSSARSASTG